MVAYAFLDLELGNYKAPLDTIQSDFKLKSALITAT